MYSMRLIHLLLVALGFVAAAQATFLRNDGAPDAALRIRQDEQSTPSDSATPEPTPTTTDPTNDPTPSPTTEPGDGTTTTTNAPPTSRSTTSTPTTTNEPDPTTSSGSPPDNSPSDTASNNDDTTTTRDSETTTSRPSAFTTTLVITSTDAEGRTTEITSKSEVTPDPTLNPGGDDDNNNGSMPTHTRNVIIGVVCGVGGAIVLGALGFVAWRVWGRKKRAEENDGLMDYHTAGTSAFNSEAKPDAMSNSTGPSRSPFQTTLEDYHRPGQVNASSNF